MIFSKTLPLWEKVLSFCHNQTLEGRSFIKLNFISFSHYPPTVILHPDPSPSLMPFSIMTTKNAQKQRKPSLIDPFTRSAKLRQSEYTSTTTTTPTTNKKHRRHLKVSSSPSSDHLDDIFFDWSGESGTASEGGAKRKKNSDGEGRSDGEGGGGAELGGGGGMWGRMGEMKFSLGLDKMIKICRSWASFSFESRTGYFRFFWSDYEVIISFYQDN